MHRYLITGATDGIGAALVSQLLDTSSSLEEVKIIVVGRSREKFQKLSDLLTTPQQQCLAFHQHDLSLMHQVQALAETLKQHAGEEPLDAVIHCAGLMLPQRTVTTEGLETVFAVQYLARFYLNHLLVPLMNGNGNANDNGDNSKNNTKPVIVVVSAGGSITRNPSQLDWDNLQGEKKYDGVHALKHESIANDMQQLKYQQMHPSINWYNYGPGYVRDTKLLDNMPAGFRWMAGAAGRFIGISAQQAAKDILELLCHPEKYQAVLYQRGLKATKEGTIPWRMQPENQEELFRISHDLLKKVGIEQ